MSAGKGLHSRPERVFTPKVVPQGASSVKQTIPNKNRRAELVARRRDSGNQTELTLGGQS